MDKKSITEMAQGAFMEMVDYEMAGVIANILDPNVKATEKRSITVTLEFTPDDTRQCISVDMQPKTKLAPVRKVTTTLYATPSEGGAVIFVEAVPQSPGQLSFSGKEQPKPAQLKLIQRGAA